MIGSFTRTHRHLEVGLPELTRRDIDRFIAEGRRLRAEEGDRLLRLIGRGISRRLVEPAVAALRATGLPQRLELARMWRRERARVAAELGAYSDRELAGDLRMNASEIPGIAAEEADRRVAEFVRANPAYRPAYLGERRDRPAAAPAGHGFAYAGR